MRVHDEFIGTARRALTSATVMLLARHTRYVEPEMLGLSDLIGPGSVCLDIGSSAGLYTLAMSGLTGSAGHVHSVEPVAFVYPALTRLLDARSARNVTHHAVALGADVGRGVMSVPVGRHGPVTGRSFLDWKCSGQGSNAEFASQIEVEVEMQTLDGLAAAVGLTRLDFVKIDVEGAELLVLEGGERTIKAFQPAMLIEIEDRHTARYRHSAADVAGWLTDRDYTIHTWDNGWRPASGICLRARNYLFLPPGWQGSSQPWHPTSATAVSPGSR